MFSPVGKNRSLGRTKSLGFSRLEEKGLHFLSARSRSRQLASFRGPFRGGSRQDFVGDHADEKLRSHLALPNPNAEKQLARFFERVTNEPPVPSAGERCAAKRPFPLPNLTHYDFPLMNRRLPQTHFQPIPKTEHILVHAVHGCVNFASVRWIVSVNSAVPTKRIEHLADSTNGSPHSPRGLFKTVSKSVHSPSGRCEKGLLDSPKTR